MTFFSRWFGKDAQAEQAEALYRKYLPTLRRRCRNILRNDVWVEDALQEIFGTIFRQQDQYRGHPEQILPWLYRITTTHCLKLLAREKRWFDRIEQAFEDSCYTPPDVELPLSLEERVAMVQMLAKLPEAQREALVLHYVSGLTQDEIAEVMDVSRNQVRRWLNTSLQKGRRMLQEPSSSEFE